MGAVATAVILTDLPVEPRRLRKLGAVAGAVGAQRRQSRLDRPASGGAGTVGDLDEDPAVLDDDDAAVLHVDAHAAVVAAQHARGREVVGVVALLCVAGTGVFIFAARRHSYSQSELCSGAADLQRDGGDPAQRLVPAFMEHAAKMNFELVAVSDIWNRRREEGGRRRAS